MSIASSAPAGMPWRDERHGPLPALLLILTVVTGLVDAVSYLKLGHVFVANMTGNIVFLGFAMADAQEFSIAASLVATLAFLAGALGGGRLAAIAGHHRGRLLALAIYLEIALVAAALLASTVLSEAGGEPNRYALIVLLALAMGLQNAIARRLGVPDLTTTVLTLTLTGLAADSKLGTGLPARPGRRLLATLAMFLGAAIGALVIFHFGLAAVLALALAMLIANGAAAHRVASSPQAWTVGALGPGSRFDGLSAQADQRAKARKGSDMEEKDADQAVLAHIQKLVAEEHGLFERAALDDSESGRLKAVQVALDQCWDLLRQRRAMRETGQPASDAQVRPPEIVERYIG